MKKTELLERIKQIVLKHDAEASVLLYGSHARGDADAESDWDLMVLSDRVVNKQHREDLSRELYELEWETGEVLCPAYHTYEEWNSPLYSVMPFRQNVERESVRL